MTNPAPGWYPDGQGVMRWWDGYRWTADAPSVIAPAPRVPADTPTGTVWIWLVVLMPLASLIPTIGYLSDFQGRMLTLFSQMQSIDPTQPGYDQQILRAEMSVLWTPWYVALIAVAALTYALTVVFAALDRRSLRARGFERTFHWAWAFLAPPWVYVIGRAVMVRRESGRGLAPLWTMIGVEVAAFVISIVWAAIFLTQMMQSVTTMVGSYPS